MDTTVLVAVVGGVSALGGAAIAGAVSLWVGRRTADAQDKTADAAVIAAEVAARAQISEGFRALTAQYENRNKELVAQNAELNGKLDEALEKLDEALGRADQLAGEVRDLTQHVESLEAALRSGRPIPARRKRPHPMAQPPLVALPDPDAPDA